MFEKVQAGRAALAQALPPTSLLLVAIHENPRTAPVPESLDEQMKVASMLIADLHSLPVSFIYMDNLFAYTERLDPAVAFRIVEWATMYSAPQARDMAKSRLPAMLNRQSLEILKLLTNAQRTDLQNALMRGEEVNNLDVRSMAKAARVGANREGALPLSREDIPFRPKWL